jgi:hypothetical protein
LKQTYGKGYQVNLKVDPQNLDEVNALIHNVLPNPIVSSSNTTAAAAGATGPGAGGVGAAGSGSPIWGQQQQHSNNSKSRC